MGSFFGKSPSGSTTTTASPWAGATPYLTGQNAYGQNAGVPGTMPSAATQYQNSGWSPAMQTQANNWQTMLNNGASPMITAQGNAATNLTQGGMSFHPNSVGPIAGAPQVYAPTASSVNSNISDYLNGMGGLNPTGSIQQLMSGQVSPGTMGSIGNEAGAMYGQATQNLLQQVMPAIDSQAVGAGGYGGSRQGIAQGLALSNMQQNLAPAIGSLYNNANMQAMQNQNSTANNIAGLGSNASNLNAQLGTNVNLANAANALTASEANAANALAGQQFNANLGLQNNQQNMAANQQNVANILAGGQLGSTAYNNANNVFQTGMNLTQAPNAYNWQNLNNYTGNITGTAGLGGSQTQPYFNNGAANLASTGLTGLLGYKLLSSPAANVAAYAAG